MSETQGGGGARGGGGLPGAPQKILNFPENPIEFVLDGFDTLNTKPTRPAIEQNQMYICDGFMPFGKNHLRTMYGVGSSIYTAPSGLTVVLHWFGNLFVGTVNTRYCVVFLSDGSVIAINRATSAQTTIAPAGTIKNPNTSNIGITQWGNKYFIITNAPVGGDPPSAQVSNGYFIWDGTLFYQAGTLSPEVSIQSDGTGYTSTPTVTAVGGEGSGATFNVVMAPGNGAIQNITVSNPGSGYNYYDYVYLAFSGGGGNTTAIATANLTGGTVSSISIVNGGTGYTSTTVVNIYGGGGTGATVTSPSGITISGGVITGITLTHNGEGYLNPPTVVITDPANTVAKANVILMPIGVAGTAVETYQQHAWVIDGGRAFFTATESVADFATSDGGGAFTSSDSFLRSQYTAIKQSNGFLYLVADSSFNSISGVTTSGTPPTTTFANQNVDPQIGTSWPGTVQTFSRNIIFANPFGVHAAYGGAVTKVSAALDGIYNSNPPFNPSAGVAIVFGIHVYVMLMQITDQITGQPVNKLILWDGKRWWTTNQEVNFTWITTEEYNSDLTVWGTDGSGIYPLFQQPSSQFTKTVQSKLWEDPSYFFVKMANRVFSLINYNEPSSQTFNIAIDNGVAATINSFTQSAPALTWSGLAWTGLTWQAAGIVVSAFAASQTGSLLGLTAQTTAPDVTVLSISMVAQNYQPLL